MSLTDILQSRIRAKGPISLAEYMAEALAHPQFGYYMHKDPFGWRGDFITAPEISQMFGELIGAWLAAAWLDMGSPEAALVELGPGRGTLLKDLLRVTKSVPDFHQRTTLHLVENSPLLKTLQQKTLEGLHPRITWHKDFSEIPAKPLLLIANEFFDALPIRQFEKTEAGYRERLVGLDTQGRFTVQLAENATELFNFLPYPTHRPFIEVCPAALAVIRSIAQHIRDYGGVALVADYGYERGSSGDTLQAVKNHVPHPVLEYPGEADLTAHVDFRALRMAAERIAKTAGPVEQGAFLKTLGIVQRAERLCCGALPPERREIMAALERLTSPAQMGSLFKVMAVAHPSTPNLPGLEEASASYPAPA